MTANVRQPMSTDPAKPLIVVDVGNTRIKLGLFVEDSRDGLPDPIETLDLAAGSWETAELARWLESLGGGPYRWRIASVFRAASAKLCNWLAAARPEDSVLPIHAADLPLAIEVPAPEAVGIDRLLAAVAANMLRKTGRAATVVDLGSAITVDLVTPSGAFAGGAILPGIGMSARALSEQTDRLPQLPLSELDEPPPVLGTSTVSAIESGLYWGAVGGVRELIGRFAAGLPEPPLVLLTGGAAPGVAKLLGEDARYVEHLVLSGIVLADRSDRSRAS